MKLKELLKPTWGKILPALILVIIFTPVEFDGPECDAMNIVFGCPYQTKTIIGLAMLENADRFMAFMY